MDPNNDNLTGIVPSPRTTLGSWSLLLPGLSERMARELVDMARVKNISPDAEAVDPNQFVRFGYDRATVAWLLAALSDSESRVPKYYGKGTEIVPPGVARERVIGLLDDYREFLDPALHKPISSQSDDIRAFDLAEWTDPSWEPYFPRLSKAGAKSLLKAAKVARMSAGGELIDPDFGLSVFYDKVTTALLLVALSGDSMVVRQYDGTDQEVSPHQARQRLENVLDQYRAFLHRN